MRVKTVRQIVEKIHEEDPESAVNRNMLLTLFGEGLLSCCRHGNRLVADYDTVLDELCDRLEIPAFRGFAHGASQGDLHENSHAVLHLRSIEKAYRYMKETNAEFGLSEKNLRELVRLGRLPHVQVGNRCYIALESLTEPYVSRWLMASDQPVRRKTVRHRDAVMQLNQVLSRSAAPTKTVVMTRNRKGNTDRK